MIDVIIPGKAYEIAAKSREVDLELRLKLKEAEKRKKGRGYRVFVSLTEDEAASLAKFYGGLDLSKLSVVDAQAIKNATSRFYSVSDAEQVERPKAKKAAAGTIRDSTAAAIWEIIYPMIDQRNCKCQLRKGMTTEDLRELGGGCTDPHDLKYKILKMPKPDPNTKIVWRDHPGYVCTVLDCYRRAVGKLD